MRKIILTGVLNLRLKILILRRKRIQGPLQCITFENMMACHSLKSILFKLTVMLLQVLKEDG